jgi:hypothetical protein
MHAVHILLQRHSGISVNVLTVLRMQTMHFFFATLCSWQLRLGLALLNFKGFHLNFPHVLVILCLIRVVPSLKPNCVTRSTCQLARPCSGLWRYLCHGPGRPGPEPFSRHPVALTLLS